LAVTAEAALDIAVVVVTGAWRAYNRPHLPAERRCTMVREQDKRGLSRRGFLKTVGAGTAAAAACRLPPAVPGARELAAQTASRIRLDINGHPYELLVEPRWSLLFLLREKIGLTGAKAGCERGECGACTVLVDALPRYSCLTLAVEVVGRRVTTVEGLMAGEELGTVQRAFADHDAFQCGYCTPGQVMAVHGLLLANPNPSLDDIRAGVSGNLCRCGTYTNIFAAAETAAKRKRG
jgi:xanthine dehydrogenase YagT iron-sulfur-binding subunit